MVSQGAGTHLFWALRYQTFPGTALILLNARADMTAIITANTLMKGIKGL
jgi:hypothetical protein